MRILTLDPGLRAPGLAAFEGGELVWASSMHSSTGCRGPEQWARVSRATSDSFSVKFPSGNVDVLVVEKPQVYTCRNNANPDDLIELSAALGACVATVEAYYFIEKYVTYLPREWKGQVPKEVHHRRIRRALKGTEQAALKKCLAGIQPDLQHNALDAVGLGLKYLGRIK